jgi:shikimate dehydrogenase
MVKFEEKGGYHLGLVGWPLGHSLSPRLHNAALAALNLPGEYQLFPAPPFPEGQACLPELLDQVRKGTPGAVHGLNVTIPHKQNVLPLLDELTPTATAIGAANLIFLKDGRLTGDNTDAAGFLADLQHIGLANPTLNSQTALVLGAGGSTRAVVYALVNSGWQVWIAARRIEQASALAASLQVTGPDIHTLLMQPDALACAYDLIVNTTPLGMYPDVESNPWPAELPFPPGACVYDLVYNPFETALVRQARAAGLRAANGLGMLVNQAAIAFETWTGQPAPLTAMWDAVAPQEEKTQS